MIPYESGLRASTVADITKFSIPRPGAQVAIISRLSSFGVTLTAVNPASASQASTLATGAAPAMQPQSKALSVASSAESGAVLPSRSASTGW